MLDGQYPCKLHIASQARVNLKVSAQTARASDTRACVSLFAGHVSFFASTFQDKCEYCSSSPNRSVYCVPVKSQHACQYVSAFCDTLTTCCKQMSIHVSARM